jgi:hypothetical protein
MRKLVLLIFIALSALLVKSQQTTFESAETVYSTEIGGGMTIHTSSWGVNFYMARFLTGFSKIQYHFELVGMRSQRQYRVPVDNGGYYYGKLNSMLILRTSVGYMKEFLPRQSLKGISVSYVLNAGLSHGFVKPIYLQIRKENNNVVDERYDPEKHNTNNIVGRSILFIGMDELAYHPGLFLRSALNFDYGGRSNTVRAIEVGLAADVFLKSIPIMAYEEPHQYFVTAFVSLEFGSRKYDGETKDNRVNFEE